MGTAAVVPLEVHAFGHLPAWQLFAGPGGVSALLSENGAPPPPWSKRMHFALLRCEPGGVRTLLLETVTPPGPRAVHF